MDYIDDDYKYQEYIVVVCLVYQKSKNHDFLCNKDDVDDGDGDVDVDIVNTIT